MIRNEIIKVPLCFVYDTKTGKCLYKEPNPIKYAKCKSCKFDIK